LRDIYEVVTLTRDRSLAQKGASPQLGSSHCRSHCLTDRAHDELLRPRSWPCHTTHHRHRAYPVVPPAVPAPQCVIPVPRLLPRLQRRAVHSPNNRGSPGRRTDHPCRAASFFRAVVQAVMKFGDDSMKSPVRAAKSECRSFTARTYYSSLACFMKLPTDIGQLHEAPAV
jgi:hypothetical protein